MPFTEHQKALITAHYGEFSAEALAETEADYDAGNYSMDWEGLEAEHGAAVAAAGAK